MNRFPYWSKDRLGSQHASPRGSPAPRPISLVVHVLPPSKLTPSSIPAASPASPWPTLVTVTMLLGLVGLTAIASSDSLKCRWLMSTLTGVAAPVWAAASAAGPAASAAPATVATAKIRTRRRHMACPSSPYYGTPKTQLALLCDGAGLSWLARGQAAAYGRAEPGCGVDAEGAADRGQPVRHALQAGTGCGLCGVKAVAVVGDGELEVAIGAGQGDLGGRSTGVFRHVLQRLQDAEVGSGFGVPPVAADPVRLDQDRKRGPAGLRPHGCSQPLFGQQRRVDPAGQGAQVIQCRVQAVPELAGELPDLGGVVRGVVQHGELDHERDELLLGAVVQVPFDPLPFLVLGPDQPPSRRPQVVDGGLQLGGQADVAQHQPRLRRQVGQQLV